MIHSFRSLSSLRLLLLATACVGTANAQLLLDPAGKAKFYGSEATVGFGFSTIEYEAELAGETTVREIERDMVYLSGSLYYSESLDAVFSAGSSPRLLDRSTVGFSQQQLR